MNRWGAGMYVSDVKAMIQTVSGSSKKFPRSDENTGRCETYNHIPLRGDIATESTVKNFNWWSLDAPYPKEPAKRPEYVPTAFYEFPATATPASESS